MGWFHDERGTRSMARALMLVSSAVLMTVFVLDTLTEIPVAASTDAYSAMTGLVVILGAWAGGPRVMQHLSPVASSIFSRLGTGGGGGSRHTTVVVGDNPHVDDERG